MTARRTQKKYGTDPELDRYCIRLPFSPAMLIPARPAMRAMYDLTPTPRGVRHAVMHSGSLRLDVFEPLARVRGLPCLIYMHGGGFGYMAAPYHKKLAAVYAREVGCRVVCPDYRLVPRHPYPAAREDCLAALEWVEENTPAVVLPWAETAPELRLPHTSLRQSRKDFAFNCSCIPFAVPQGTAIR